MSNLTSGGRSRFVVGAAAQICSVTAADHILRVFRSDGQLATVDVNGAAFGPKANVSLTADNPTELDTTHGSATGSIKSYHLSFTITPNGGGAGETYEGEVVHDGSVTGWIQYTKPQINWTSPKDSVKCTSETNGGTATATQDVDVYSKPGGDDQFKMGFLDSGTQVNLVKGGGCPSDDWCHVTGSNVPNGDGYAWGSFFKSS